MSSLVLDALVALPALGALLAAAVPASGHRLVWFSLGLSTVVLGLSIGAWVAVVDSGPGFHFESDASWIEPIGVRWTLGLDSLSAPLVVVTALLSWCCLVSLVRRAPDCGGSRQLAALVLLIEAGSIGTFVALDLIVFFVFFELVLIPMWFVIADWGDSHDAEGRRRAATRFLVVTVVGSALVLVAFLLLRSETGSFDLTVVADRVRRIDHGRQVAIAALLLVGFGAKVPVWPLHFWLPDAHSKAPTVGSVLLAGVLLKLGTYGLLRFWYDVVPAGALEVAPYLGGLGVVGIVYGALACLAQPDLKRMVAYSSIGHMGFVALAISTMTPQGLLAANFANVAHGAITGLLFFLVGGLKDRLGGTTFDTIGRGLYGRAPRLAALFAVAAMASLGLPGLAGFWGEMLTMLAAFSPNPALPQTTYLVLMALAGLGVVLTTGYFVVAVRRICQGVGPGDSLSDVASDEWLAWAPLVLVTVGLGVAPMAMLWSADGGASLVSAVLSR